MNLGFALLLSACAPAPQADSTTEATAAEPWPSPWPWAGSPPRPAPLPGEPEPVRWIEPEPLTLAATALTVEDAAVKVIGDHEYGMGYIGPLVAWNDRFVVEQRLGNVDGDVGEESTLYRQFEVPTATASLIDVQMDMFEILHPDDISYTGLLRTSADLDGDGMRELGIASVHGSAVEVSFISAEAPGPLAAIELSSWTACVAAHADYDGDGSADFAFSDGFYQHTIFGPLTGELGEQDAVRVGMGVTRALPGDLDGDGDDELAGAWPEGEVVEILDDFGGGAESFPYLEGGASLVIGERRGELDSSFDTTVGAFEDMDGDGYDDLLVTVPNYEGLPLPNGAAFVIRGPYTGQQEIEAAADVAILSSGLTGDTAWCCDWLGDRAAVGDLDGDQVADIALWQRVESDQPGGRPVWSIFLSPASGTLVDRDADLDVRGLPPTDGDPYLGDPYDLLIEDYDGDGRKDLIVGFWDPEAPIGAGAYAFFAASTLF